MKTLSPFIYVQCCLIHNKYLVFLIRVGGGGGEIVYYGMYYWLAKSGVPDKRGDSLHSGTVRLDTARACARGILILRRLKEHYPAQGARQGEPLN